MLLNFKFPNNLLLFTRTYFLQHFYLFLEIYYLYVTVHGTLSCSNLLCISRLLICVFRKHCPKSSTLLLTNTYKCTTPSLYNRTFPSCNSSGVLGSKGDRMLLYNKVGGEHEILCLQGTRASKIEMGSVGTETHVRWETKKKSLQQ
jgi:hypothetical protein